MNEIHAPKQPSRLLVDITFWVANLGWAIFFVLWFAPPPYAGDSETQGAFCLVGLISLVMYFFALGRYVQKRGESGVMWGGGAFIASFPFLLIPAWVTYIASFFIKTKKCPYCTRFIHEEAIKCPYCTSVV
jgi:hypothetical protein